ncbi:hypothetical protein NX059_007595 [Plenodomus lindquistii]|nr:hypothetical protein NX059_007595 [Plenodomus lindquistii]
MAEQSTSAAQAANTASATAPSAQSANTIATQNSAHARFHSNACSRFADARNSDHSRACVSTSRALIGSPADDFELPCASALTDRPGITLPFAQAAALRAGSYAPMTAQTGFWRDGGRGPYDQTRQENLPDDQNTMREPTTPLAPPVAPGSRPTTNISAAAVGTLGGRSATRAIRPAEDARERQILLGPLRLAYHHCLVRKPENQDCSTHPASAHNLYLQFFEERMAGELQTIVEQDPFIPGVVYVVKIRMTDLVFQTYHKILASIAEAATMQELLGVETGGFYMLNASSERAASLQDAYHFMVECNSKGQGLEETMEELVAHFGPLWKSNSVCAG